MIMHFARSRARGADAAWRSVLVHNVQHLRDVLQCLGRYKAFPFHGHGGLNMHAKRSSSSGKPPEADLQRQLVELTSVCEALAKQVEYLSRVVQAKGSNNLLELQAAKGEGFPDRYNFRPTLDLVAHQVNHTSQFDNATLCNLAINGDGFACRERLVREIMEVDGCTWDKAHDKLIEIDVYCEQMYWLNTFPYRIGMAFAFVGGLGAILLVFNKTCAKAYGEEIAGENLPTGVGDIAEMTYNQVGTWTWSWMEPMIGTASFVLLCCQFWRAQSVQLNMRPYKAAMLKWRGTRVAHKYPQYDAAMVRLWARQMPAVGWNFMPTYRRTFYTEKMRTENLRGGV